MALAVFAASTIFMFSKGEFSLLLRGRSITIRRAAWVFGLKDLEVNFVERVPRL
jgi:hypothetical protein